MAYNIIGRFGRNLTTGTDHRAFEASVTENEVREVLCIALLHLSLTHRQGNFIHHLSVQLRRSYEKTTTILMDSQIMSPEEDKHMILYSKRQ